MQRIGSQPSASMETARVPGSGDAITLMRQVTDATDPSYLVQPLRRSSAPGTGSFFRVALGWVSKRPAPGFHRPRLSTAGIDLYCSPSTPIVLCACEAASIHEC